MRVEWLRQDVRYAVRAIRAAPLFAASVAVNMGLGLGILCSAFTIVNAYLLKPIGLPDPHALYALSWDTDSASDHAFGLADYQSLSNQNPVFSAVAAGDLVRVMEDGIPITGQVVTGNYFHVLGARAALGRTLLPEDTLVPGAQAVVVLSYDAWHARYGADPAILGKAIVLGRQRFEVVGVTEPGASLPGDETVGFWAPLTMARAFAIPDPSDAGAVPSLFVLGRLRPDSGEAQARAWFDAWLRQRFPSESPAGAPRARMESRATRIPLNGATLVMSSLIVAACGMVLLVACANVTNLMMARGFSRQRELAIRLAVGASRGRVVRQLLVESLVLTIPAALVGLGITFATARVLPLVILGTLPDGSPPAAPFLAPIDPDWRVVALLIAAAVAAAVLVGLSPALHVTRRALARGVTEASGADRVASRWRAGLVAGQIGASALFLVGAIGLVIESTRLSRADTGLEYERVVAVSVAADLRAKVAARLASDPAVERVAAVGRPPLAGPLGALHVLPSNTSLERTAGYMTVSPEYFAVFGLRVVRGRAFTSQEAEDNAAVAVISEATARQFWPGQDPLGQTLEIRPRDGRSGDGAVHARVRVVGVAGDVVSGSIIDGLDPTCVYLPTRLSAPGELAILLRARGDVGAVKRAVALAVAEVQADAAFQVYGMREQLALQVWAFAAFAAVAGVLGIVGVVLAFSGTYAVVAFLITQRARELAIRMALGATVQRIVAGIVGDMLRVAAAGGVIGLLGAATLARAADATIETMPALGADAYLIGAAVVLAATVAAALLPSLRTARIDPSAVLRME